MKKLILLLTLTSLLLSCSNSDNNSGTNSPNGLLKVSTEGIYDIRFTSANCVGSITQGGSVLEAGFCYSNTPNPTISGQHTSAPVTGTNSFTLLVSSLLANTTYYVRAYATDSNGTVYGTQITFNTLNILSSNGGGVIDIDGESYSSILLNGKEWMKKNLNVSKYRNGDVIPQITDPTAWINATTGAWCYYENDTANGPIYGKLYNWYAVNDPRGLAPAGWHIPTDTEWSDLANYLGGENVAGKKLKDDATTSTWDVTTNPANNQSGFTGLPTGTGYLNYHSPAAPTVPTLADLFKYKTKVTYWWSATATGNTTNDIGWTRNINSTTDQLVRSGIFKSSAISVRCVKN
jgi:uncharacterized protein (TIGR02145 family)